MDANILGAGTLVYLANQDDPAGRTAYEEPPFDPVEPGVELIDAPQAARTVQERTDTFPIHTLSEALQPRKPFTWRVAGMMRAGGLYAFVGDSGSKKSFLMLDLAVRLAIGAKTWAGVNIAGCPVLFVQEEGGLEDQNERLAALLSGMGVTNVGGARMGSVIQERFDACNPEAVQTLRRTITQWGAGVVILDSMMDVLPGRDENSVKEILPGLAALSRLAKDTGCTVILIHHTNKTGGYRGSTAIRGALDGMFVVESSTDSPQITVRTDKGRHSRGVTLYITSHFEGDENDNLVSVSFEPSERPADKVYSVGEKYVMEYLKDNGPSKKPEIESRAVTCSTSTARDAIYSLEKRGVIRRTDSGGSGSVAIYALINL